MVFVALDRLVVPSLSLQVRVVVAARGFTKRQLIRARASHLAGPDALGNGGQGLFRFDPGISGRDLLALAKLEARRELTFPILPEFTLRYSGGSFGNLNGMDQAAGNALDHLTETDPLRINRTAAYLLFGLQKVHSPFPDRAACGEGINDANRRRWCDETGTGLGVGSRRPMCQNAVARRIEGDEIKQDRQMVYHVSSPPMDRVYSKL